MSASNISEVTMELRIEIKTIKGYAISTAQKLKPFILGTRRVENKLWANKADDVIYWVVDCPNSRSYLQIAKNLAVFDKLVNGILGNRLVLGAAKISSEDRLKLKDMLHNQTKIRLVKKAEEYNLAEFDAQPEN
jgi:hypothetical protein